MTDYYCEIPWAQVWEEFDEWCTKPGRRYAPDWEEQEPELQRILIETIPWPLPWGEIWAAFEEWWQSVADDYVEWGAQQRKLRRLVQKAADIAVNKAA
jgi:hypothetical protein